MDFQELLGGNAVFLTIALFILLCIWLGVRIVPQSEKHVVERFGRLRAVLGPGINFIVPFLDRVAHRISVLERQLPTHKQDAITADNVLVTVDTSVFYRITEPEKTVYRIRDVDGLPRFDVEGDIPSMHYAFLISDSEFDEIFGRIKARKLKYWADPDQSAAYQINTRDGGRAIYFEDPSGHLLEILTRPYGSGDA